MTRVADVANAVALGMMIGALLPEDDAQRPAEWQDIGWDQIVTDIVDAADALDRVQQQMGDDMWETYDWYLSLDAIGAEVFRDPRAHWTNERLTACLVTQ